MKHFYLVSQLAWEPLQGYFLIKIDKVPQITFLSVKFICLFREMQRVTEYKILKHIAIHFVYFGILDQLASIGPVPRLDLL